MHNMKNYIGMKWSELTEEEKEELLRRSNVDNDNVDKRTGECIVDLTDTLSVEGRRIFENDEEIINVDDDAVIYNPCEGVVEWRTPQEKWQAKVGLISKSYKLDRQIVSNFKASCDKAGVTQAKQLEKMMKQFIEGEIK